MIDVLCEMCGVKLGEKEGDGEPLQHGSGLVCENHTPEEIYEFFHPEG